MSNSSASKLGFPTSGIPNLLKREHAAPISVIPSVVSGPISVNPIEQSLGKVNLFDILDSVTISSNEHLLIHEGDTPTVKQIKGLTKEVSVLRNELTTKNKLIESLTMKDQVPVTGQGVGASWKDKVSPPGASHSRMKLQFFPPAVEGETIRVSPPQHVEIHGAEQWKDCIVGHFVDKKLPFLSVRSIAFNNWGKYGLKEVLANENGFFFFQFGIEGAYRQISESLPQNKVWVVKSGKAVEDLNTNPETSRIQKSPMAADVNLPCSNQFSALQGGEDLSNDQAVFEQRAITALNDGLTGCAAAPLGNSEPLIDVGLEHLVDDNCNLDEAGISTLVPPALEVPAVYDFLPHDLDPDVVFEALTVMEASNSKKANGGQNLGAGRKRRNSKKKLSN
ncbi:hypothetical protein RHGRI_031039 [Rhododendron griersonianum]|uniref:DUF4283 domain-containing protein n=1 Tax=Rhododendron griersonianum TaxID=479676 RepID=A0AAV6I9I4_9ERIC|nr:hypothetical protein RHGRI_031039 [Rhododendron griersonianum]